jgi:hypothetical protein
MQTSILFGCYSKIIQQPEWLNSSKTMHVYLHEALKLYRLRWNAQLLFVIQEVTQIIPGPGVFGQGDHVSVHKGSIASFSFVDQQGGVDIYGHIV